MHPPHQALEADDAAPGERHDRLVVHHELLALHRAPEIHLHLEQGDHRSVHGGVEHLVAGPPCRLGPVHGRVGVAEDIGGVTVARGAEGDADARRGHHLMGVDFEGLRERLENALGDPGGVARGDDVSEKHGELVAAQPRNRVPGPQAGGESPRELEQQLVSHRMSQAVVDVLEAVDVEKEHAVAGVLVPPRLLHGEAEAVHEEAPVGELCEGVVEGVVEDLLLDPLALAHVGERAGHPVGAAESVPNHAAPGEDPHPAAVAV